MPTHLYRRRRRFMALIAAAGCAILLIEWGVRAEAPKGALKTFTITATKYKFDPARIEVTAGDTVRLILKSADVTHGFAIREFGVKAKLPKDGTPVTVEFLADQAGTFNFTCSVYCGSGHRGMKGQLVVAAPAAAAR
jgi:cytochrome c oxidase subunit 2